MFVELFNEAFSTFRIGIATVHKAMNESFVDPVFFCNIRQFKQVLERAMHSAVRDKPHKVNLLVVFFRITVSTFDFRIFQDCILAASDIDFYQILINDTSCADIQVTYFRVSHLSVG